MDDNSGEFSDELDVFEESIDESKQIALRNQTTYTNKPYDEAIEISQDLSMAESFDGREKVVEREKKMKNDKYDEAIELSQSVDQVAISAAAGKSKNATATSDDKEFKGLKKGNDQSKSQSVLNKPFDEALEFSHSGSEESVDTRASQKVKRRDQSPDSKAIAQTSNKNPALVPQMESKKPALNQKQAAPSAQQHGKVERDEEESDEGEGEAEESYENLEGQYNSKDYQQLNVTAEVRDLFQYIERYKPQEVELDTPLRCFIPEYIPAIGELDAFIKVPRPDGKEDGLGLRYLDEPSSNQSDPTVLELQLRAKSKKLQYGDVVVRSIEQADKNPGKIEKWIQDINELHRSKPPPQVNYKKNMPDIDKLMDVWPAEFETLLSTAVLPSPELDLSLGEYAKTLCSLLDIPTYDNPIESLHLMFTLFIDFRNNPHFQARLLDNLSGEAEEKGEIRGRQQNHMNNYGNADVMEMDQDYK